MREILSQDGPLKGLEAVFGIIDELDRDDLIHFVCPGKYYAWNLQPSQEGKSGSVEFRRAPGVVTSKKAKHWIALTMAIIWMSIKFEPRRFINSWTKARGSNYTVHHPNFQEQLLCSARDIGQLWNLDSRLLQVDNVANLHITMMSQRGFDWLSQKGLGYAWSKNA